eukprot:TRINITY_DN9481_c1_g3_i1.p1 TRINITY_DN9481_c1_g3~~TRINITY_DN9481_c1_g3_i1.p1  ORF type:complete len:520 (-),score=158.05 TRINITY_DN9481_c1_g3_i1:422-1981(-)
MACGTSPGYMMGRPDIPIDASYCSAEAVLDEVGQLEAALREAVEGRRAASPGHGLRRGMSPCGGHGGGLLMHTAPAAANGTQVGYQPSAPFQLQHADLATGSGASHHHALQLQQLQQQQLQQLQQLQQQQLQQQQQASHQTLPQVQPQTPQLRPLGASSQAPSQMASMQQLPPSSTGQTVSACTALQQPPQPPRQLSHILNLDGCWDSSASVETYGMQLRAWIDMHVDARLQHVLEGELLACRHDSAAAIGNLERVEAEIVTLTESQSKLLSVVEGLSEETAKMKTAAPGRGSAYSFAGSPVALDSQAWLQQREELERDLEAKLQSLRLAVSAETAASSAAMCSEIEVKLEHHRKALARISEPETLRRDLQDRFGLDDLKAQVAAAQELALQQQRLLNEFRADTTAAFRNEAATVAALDEQLWLTDQRLGQRIDELAHLHLRDRMELSERALPSRTERISGGCGGCVCQGNSCLVSRREVEVPALEPVASAIRRSPLSRDRDRKDHHDHHRDRGVDLGS